ncbi:hypothetical protein [Peribacillus loiseleuriae]|uniref:hypothetical protein n=1 Tax=Peribacillus loiseleuriae TaxID=1679170 RepID=UPI003CFBCFA2
MTTVSNYVVSEYQVSFGMAGLTVGIFVSSALLAHFFAGRYLERIERKRALIESFAAVAISMLLHFGVNSLNISVHHTIYSGSPWLSDSRRRCGFSGYHSRLMNKFCLKKQET